MRGTGLAGGIITRGQPAYCHEDPCRRFALQGKKDPGGMKTGLCTGIRLPGDTLREGERGFFQYPQTGWYAGGLPHGIRLFPDVRVPEPQVSCCQRNTRRYLPESAGALWSACRKRWVIMVWERRMRRFAWVLFAVMWLPLAFVIWSAVTDAEEPPFRAMILFFVLMVLFMVLLFGSFAVGSYEKKRIRISGTEAKATILSVSETGMRLNDQPIVRIALEVQPPYDSRFVATAEYVLSYGDLSGLEEGRQVRVYYREDTREVALADL